MIAVVELAHTGGRSRRDQIPWTKGQAAREKSDMLAQTANHVARVRGHDLFAVLQHLDRKILRLIDLVSGHDPRPQRTKGIEPFSNIARVMHALAPRVPLADIPTDRVAEYIAERLILGNFPRPFADHRAKFAFEIDELGDFWKNNSIARTDNR